MHGILFKVTVPPVIAGAIFLAAYLAGYPLIGAFLGTLTGAGIAYRTGTSARRRLSLFRHVAERDDRRVIDEYPFTDQPDEIDEAHSRLVARLQDRDAAFAEEMSVLSSQSQLLDRMNDGIMRIDAQGDITYANIAAGALFRGRNPTGRSFIAVARDHELSDLVQRNLRTGEDQQHTFEIPGDISVFNAVITRLADDPPEALVVLRDITEVTRLQTLRRDFVANVSHDLRTPLSAIKIMNETLLELRPDDPDSQRFLAKIDDEVNVMTALVNDLLDLASLEGGEARLSMRFVNLLQVVEDVRERMEPIADRHEVRLAVNVAPDLEEMEADERRVNQVLVNLVNNAIVHTPAGGKVEISVFPERHLVVFEIRDTGVGIHPDDLPRVWERFFRADRARSGRGTGLGLAIVKHIVLAHGGTMNATSSLGKGSEFRVTFPIVQRRDGMAGRAQAE